MVDKLLLTFCFVYLLVAVQAVPRNRKFEDGDDSKEDSKEDDDNDCFLPKVVGTCRAHKDRYYFDKDAKECRIFKYGGCKGNDNNFKTLDDCTKKCGKFVMKVEEVQGKSDDGQPLLPQSEICKLPPTLGTSVCEAYMPMWTYDAKLGTCMEYIYGGCGGTKNLFRTRRECQGTCEPHKPDDPQPLPPQSEICKQPPLLGTRMCKAFMPRWTYDATLGKCKEYIYGGCGGSENLFRTKKECQETCEPREPEPKSLPGATGSKSPVCEQPIEKGQCFGEFKRYGFNRELNRCEQFSFSGCAGNDNNFLDEEECEKTCGDNPAEQRRASACANVKCDLRLYQHYAQKACKPMYLNGACCPSYYECPDPSVFDNKCFYDGKFYEVGESIPEATQQNPCRQGCFCQESIGTEHNTTIACANVECPEKLGWLAPEKKMCTPVYESADKCCASSFVNCRSATVSAEGKAAEEVEAGGEKRESICTWDGVNYVEGQRFYPRQPGAVCQVCTCTREFNGIFGPGCRTAVCSIRLPSEGCVPIYDEAVCCPYRYKCPSEYNETGVQVMKSGESTFSRDGPFISVGAPGKVPVSTLPILARPPMRPVGSPSRPLGNPSVGTYERDGPFISVGVPGKVPVSTLPIAVKPMPTGEEEGTYKRDGPYIEVGAPGKVPIRTLPIAVPQGGNTSYHREGPFIEVAAPGKVPIRTLPALVPQAEYKRDGPFIETGAPGKVPVRTLPIAINTAEGRSGVEDRCSLPIVTGPCKMSLPSFGFDKETGACIPFLYGGCKGNENRFATKEDCERSCRHRMARSDGKEACTQEPYVGPCRASKTRFFYNQTAQECQMFKFGGCRSNLNNFKTKQDCEAMCIEAPVTSEPELARSAIIPELPSIEAAPYCLFGGVRFELGEQLATNEECVQCTCSTPPELTCIKHKAPCSQSQPANQPPRIPLVGAHSEWKPITDEVKELTNSLKQEIEAQAKTNFEFFEPVKYTEQVVAGKNFRVVINTSEESFITVKIHRNLRNESSLIKIEYFAAG